MALTTKGARRVMACVVYALGLSFTGIAALGSQHGGRALNEATARALSGERARLESQYRRADAALTKLPEARPTAAIRAEIDAALKDPRLNDCHGWLQSTRLRAVCVEKVEPLRAELANAEERQRLTSELATTSEALSALTVGKPANADAESLGRYLAAFGIGATSDRLADILNLLTVASVELAGGIAFALSSRSVNPVELHKRANTVNGSINAPEATFVNATHALLVNTKVNAPVNTTKVLKTKSKHRRVNASPGGTLERIKREIVASLLDGAKACSQRALADVHGCSVGLVNKAVRSLAEAGIVRVRANRFCTRLELIRDAQPPRVSH
jgi:hypothetical protein